MEVQYEEVYEVLCGNFIVVLFGFKKIILIKEINVLKMEGLFGRNT